MLNAIIYLYYRIRKLNPNSKNIVISVQFLFIAIIHLMPLIQILDFLLGSNVFVNFWNLVVNDDVVTRRMIKLPLIILPLWLPIYFFLRKNNEKILERCLKLESLPKDILIKKNFNLWMYIVFSFIFFILGIMSSKWVPCSP